MQSPIIQQRLNAYRQWQTRVARSVREFEGWLGVEGRLTDDSRALIRSALRTLQNSRMNIALVGEFGRGKGELLNALLFADYKNRLFPTAETRTTLCPTEWLWDDTRNEAYLRLLPIETRALKTPILKLKTDPQQWVHYPLQTQDPLQLARTFGEIQQKKRLSIGEAAQLRLSAFDRPVPDGRFASPHVEVPKWRYAIISFPHSLFKQGLSAISLPGGAVLEGDPELTANILPATQALLFVLAADQGATEEDLKLWNQHLQEFVRQRPQDIVVALNKSDLLWTSPGNPHAREPGLRRPCKETARALQVEIESVLPVSARTGFESRVAQNATALEKSGLEALETAISARMLETKRRYLLERLASNVGRLLDENRRHLSERIQSVELQIAELQAMCEKSDDVIGHLLEKTRTEQELYLRGIAKFQAGREELIAKTELSRRTLAKDLIDQLIEDNHQEMLESWSSFGLSTTMKQFFEELRRAVQLVDQESGRIRHTVNNTYRYFDSEFGFSSSPPEIFDATKIHAEIDQIHQILETYRKSPGMALSRKSVVIRHYRQRMVNRVNALFDQLRSDFERSMQEALQPLASQIEAHKAMIEQRLESLERISRSKENFQKRIDEAQKQHVDLAKQLTALRTINNALHYNPLRDLS